MALIKCPECGKEISDSAKECVHCGYKLEKEETEELEKEKCPECGKYYFKTKQEVVISNKEYGGELGTLSLPEIIEAYNQFKKDGEIENIKEEIIIRMMIFHAYNDFYYRNEDGENKQIDPDYHKIFVECGQWLIDNLIHDDLMKAEFYREIGNIEKSKEIIRTLDINDDYRKNIATEIKKRLEEGDCRVFRVK